MVLGTVHMHLKVMAPLPNASTAADVRAEAEPQQAALRTALSAAGLVHRAPRPRATDTTAEGQPSAQEGCPAQPGLAAKRQG